MRNSVSLEGYPQWRVEGNCARRLLQCSFVLDISLPYDCRLGTGSCRCCAAFNEEERERLKRLITDVDNILDPALDGFFVGTRSMDEFDSVMQQAIEAGAEEIEEIYNAAEARLR